MPSPRGVRVFIPDGEVIYENGDSITFNAERELIVLAADKSELARFGPGNWVNAELVRLTDS